MINWVIALLSLLDPTPARANPQLRQSEPLWNCEVQLGEFDSITRRSLARRYGRYTVTDLPEFRGTLLTHDDERADLLTIPIPDAKLDQIPVRIEHWTEYVRDDREYWFYDIGPKHLERTSRALNQFVSRRISSGTASLHFKASARRRNILDVMSRFKWGIQQRYIAGLKRRPSKRAYLDKFDYESIITSDQNSNVDVLGVTGTRLPLNATQAQISAADWFALQITYDQPANYLGPSLDGLLNVRGEPSQEPRSLPHMARVRSDARDEYTESFFRMYGHLRTCEVGRYDRHASISDPAYARVLRRTMLRVLMRGCQVIVATQSEGVFEALKDLRLRKDRPLPGYGKKSEYRVVMMVDSTEFWATYDALATIAQFD